MELILIIGLGNPGEKYENTRHNAGFMALDAIHQKYNFSEFTLDKKSNALLAEGHVNSKHILLVKPQTYMNNSGESVKKLLQFYKADASDTTVVYDDIDIQIGETKFVSAKRGSGSAGHNGINSIIEQLGTPHFHRLRIGILPHEGKPNEVEHFVLRKFGTDELNTIHNVLESIQLPELLVDKDS